MKKPPFLRIELLPLLVLVLVAGGIWLFAELAGEVREGETRRIDEEILLALRNPADRSDPLGPRWLEEMERDFTALGGVGVLLLLTGAVSVYLVLDGKNHAAVLVLSKPGLRAEAGDLNLPLEILEQRAVMEAAQDVAASYDLPLPKVAQAVSRLVARYGD